jgi:serine protease Do
MSNSRSGWVVGALVGAVLGLGLLLALVLRDGRWFAASRFGSIDAARENAIVRATERVSPSVVGIAAFRRQGLSLNPSVQEWFRPFMDRMPGLFGPRTSDALEAFSVGSGIIVHERGYILTNHHVVAGAEQIVVTLPSGEDLLAEVVGSSRVYDLTLLKLAGEVRGLPTAPLGQSEDLRIGEWAIAIGSPYGYLLADTSPTVTVGVISATKRDLKPDASGRANLFDMIQTDAAIHPGNSGGPLVNSRGEVIGINSFLIGGQGGTGLGFAVPIDRGKWVMEEILQFGRVRDPYFGMNGAFVSPALMRELRLPESTPRGYFVGQVDRDSPAEVAGIQIGDVITEVEGLNIRNSVEMERSLFSSRVGSDVHIKVWRNGRTFDAKLTPIEPPGSGR